MSKDDREDSEIDAIFEAIIEALSQGKGIDSVEETLNDFARRRTNSLDNAIDAATNALASIIIEENISADEFTRRIEAVGETVEDDIVGMVISLGAAMVTNRVSEKLRADLFDGMEIQKASTETPDIDVDVKVVRLNRDPDKDPAEDIAAKIARAMKREFEKRDEDDPFDLG